MMDKVSKTVIFIFKYFLFSSLILFVLFFFFIIISDSKESDEYVYADGFTIEKYNVLLDVSLDNKVDVTESIIINFTNSYKHGIYKFTPRWLKYTPKDGKTISRKANILNYRAEGDPFTLDVVKGKDRIKIGSADKYVDEGEKEYTIKYTYDMGKDPFKGFDEFIFHAFGDYWGTEIKNASIRVKMPKNIEDYNVNFFTDKYRENNVTGVVDYSVHNYELIADFNSEKYYQMQLDKYCEDRYSSYSEESCDEEDFDYFYNPLEKSLTVDIELPEGYFVGGSSNYGYKSLIASLIIFLLTGFTIYKWLKYGKDYDKGVETVEFYPPNGLNAAEIGYIFNNLQANKKLTIALIVQLASKGYLKIDEVKNDKKDIMITNLVMMKPKKPSENIKKTPDRMIEVKKLKDGDNTLTLAEDTVMVHLFKKGDTKLVVDDIEKFLEVKDKLVDGGFIEIISDNEKDISDKTGEKKYEEAVEKYNSAMKKYEETISKLPKLSNMEKKVYDRLFSGGDQFILRDHSTIYKSFEEVDVELYNNLSNKIEDKTASKQVFGSIVRIIIVSILSVISYSLFEDLNPSYSILYYLSFLCIFISLFFTMLMKRKTEYGELMLAKVKGFRDFLVTCEKSKLDSLVNENPSYFYDILPYAYVLNISKKWIKKFEDIKIPEQDMGNFDFSDSYSYSLFYNDISYPVSSSSSGSGCSSCGGGCSSCGGGCSSCGGGGSW